MKVFFYIFIFVVLFLQTLANNTIDPDYWARLLQGNAFLSSGNIMKIDPFSYTQTHIWLDHEWGSSVVFSFIQNNFGFIGILLAKITIVFFIFFFIFKTIQLHTKHSSYFLNISLFGFSVYALPTLTQSGFRCHFFTFLFFTIFLYILELVRKQNKTKLLFLLPPLMLIWCNMHGGCVSGLGLLAIFTIGEILNKKPFKLYFYTLIASIAAMFINPYGFDYVKFIFMASTMTRPFITEWISPFLHPVWNFMIWFKLLVLFYLAVIIKNFKYIKKDYTKLLLLLVCLYLSCKNIKSSPFFIITASAFLYENLVCYISQKTKITSIIAMIFFVVISGLQIKSLFFLSEQPYLAVEFIRINELKGKILAPMEMGSYIAYKLYPQNLIYMDGRYEEVYFEETKKLADDFYNTKENWKDILKDKNKPDYIIVPVDAAVNDFLSAENDYKAVWKDEKNIIYILKEKLKPIYKVPTSDYNYYIRTAFEKIN